jgi:hypothetical protein
VETKQGWLPDPFGIHEMRYFSAGNPTSLVRDGATDSYDEPPAPGTPSGSGTAQTPGAWPGTTVSSGPEVPSRPAKRACPNGHVVGEDTVFCPHCGVQVQGVAQVVRDPYAQNPYGAPSPPFSVPAYWQQGAQPFHQPARGTNGMAIASLVLGILWIYWFGSILALVFGYVSLRQIRQRQESGRGMAIAGIVLGWVGVAVGVLVTVLVVIVARSHPGSSIVPVPVR